MPQRSAAATSRGGRRSAPASLERQVGREIAVLWLAGPRLDGSRSVAGRSRLPAPPAHPTRTRRRARLRGAGEPDLEWSPCGASLADVERQARLGERAPRRRTGARRRRPGPLGRGDRRRGSAPAEPRRQLPPPGPRRPTVRCDPSVRSRAPKKASRQQRVTSVYERQQVVSHAAVAGVDEAGSVAARHGHAEGVTSQGCASRGAPRRTPRRPARRPASSSAPAKAAKKSGCWKASNLARSSGGPYSAGARPPVLVRHPVAERNQVHVVVGVHVADEDGVERRPGDRYRHSSLKRALAEVQQRPPTRRAPRGTTKKPIPTGSRTQTHSRRPSASP